jgi:hypothetical protein
VDLQRIGHPGGFRRPAHSVSMEDNETAADLLERAFRPDLCRGGRPSHNGRSVNYGTQKPS